MLRSRIIPVLLMQDYGLVKTTQFANPKYVGDPLNAVKIFNEKEVDELMLIDIDATVKNLKPNFALIKTIASESNMPFCYGGGIKTVDDAKKIIQLGAEKVAISSEAIANPNLVKEIAKAIGRQSVVVVLDVKKTGLFKKYEVFVNNGKINTKKDPFQLAKQFEEIGIGELIINNIDLDGEMKGYDLKLIQEVRNCTTMPMSAIGGAGSFDDLKTLIDKFKIIGAAAGSIFVFKGKYRAVLINYPLKDEKERLLNTN